MFNGKRRSSSGASSTCSTAREHPPAEHQVHVQRQEKILQRSIKYMFNGKRTSSSGASSTCSTAREDPPAEHHFHDPPPTPITVRADSIWRPASVTSTYHLHNAPPPPQLLCVLIYPSASGVKSTQAHRP